MGEGIGAQIQLVESAQVSAYPHLFCLFDPATGICRQLFKDTKEGQAIRMVADLFMDKDSTLWIAATGEGVYSYRFDTDLLTNYRHDPEISGSLSNNNVNSIMQDSRLLLCISTSFRSCLLSYGR